ncbi:MAG: hypothetical protein KBE41_00560 [Lutibacter sp.]|nr:hypothetical protein [Lutibacter sp.]MBP9599964.1 hypothetical protein [Lutibacter sp.]
MAKAGSAKNTKNKALHSKLMKQKKNKLKSEKLTTQQKLKAIIKKSQE